MDAMTTQTDLPYKEIQLTKGLMAKVDAELFDQLSHFKWTAVFNGKSYYAVRYVRHGRGNREVIRMHRVILGLGMAIGVLRITRTMTH